MDHTTATQKLQTLRALMTGHTDRHEEKQILQLFETATAAELNYLLTNVDLSALLSDVDDRIAGPNNLTALLELLCMKRAHELGLPVREGDLTFVSARPMDPIGFIEDRTLETLRQHGVGPAVMLSGAFSHLIGNARIAEKKFDNFSRYAQLYPEYGFVFTGDSGQGDVAFGEQMLAAHPGSVRAVFIHDVVATPEPTGKAWRVKRIFFFDTYVGAAVDAYEVGVIARDGVARVAAAAREALEKIPFTSEEQRQARCDELTRDLQRAEALTAHRP